jgi:hypothetical protein
VFVIAMPLDPALLERIASARIHPSIGIARIGNSTAADGFFIGPQLCEPAPLPASAYRDRSGALKRQVAEFRLYGYDASGQVVCELAMDDNTKIAWTVELANHKAAWYNFDLALDIPEAADVASSLRNSIVKGVDRQKLCIEPGPRTIALPATQGPEYSFASGRFGGIPVDLGELRTDANGRLQVFGGLGQSGFVDFTTPSHNHKNDGPDCAPTPEALPAPVTFANNDGWYDDTSDGPVKAKVSVMGREIPVDPAWVVVAPPNYAPQLKGVRTLHALLTDVAIQAGQLPIPEKASFQNDILPIFKALCDLQWANKGFAGGFGYGMPGYLLNPRFLAKLASPNRAYQEMRRTIFHNFRSMADRDASMKPWPWIYGDAMDSPTMPMVPEAMNALTSTQLYLLSCWADGNFIADWREAPIPFTSIDDVPLQEQPGMLDRAALEFCLADAFHPGCEMTWPVRHATMYQAPYRWRHRDRHTPEPDLGPYLTPIGVSTFNGPLYGQSPGSITRWMAVPWQTDTASCRSGYDKTYDPYLPTFWPARVPNQVLSQHNYALATNPSLSREERLEAFQQRDDWNDTLGPAGPDGHQQLLHMVEHFDQQALVLVEPGVTDDPDLPPVMMVADRQAQTALTPEQRHAAHAAIVRIASRCTAEPEA